MKFCSDVDPDNKIRCCASCHEDDDYGYPLIEKMVDGEEHEICCAIARFLDEKSLTLPLSQGSLV